MGIISRYEPSNPDFFPKNFIIGVSTSMVKKCTFGSETRRLHHRTARRQHPQPRKSGRPRKNKLRGELKLAPTRTPWGLGSRTREGREPHSPLRSSAQPIAPSISRLECTHLRFLYYRNSMNLCPYHCKAPCFRCSQGKATHFHQ